MNGEMIIVYFYDMKSIALLFFIFSPVLGTSQVTFQKNYLTQGVYNSTTTTQTPAILNESDSGYYLFAWNGNNTINSHWLSISRINKNGELLWNKNSDNYLGIYNFGFGGLGGAVQYPDSSFVMLWNNSYSYKSTGFVHINKNSNALWAKRYVYPFPWVDPYMNSVAATLDKGLMGWGWVSNYYNAYNCLVLMKTDSAGNIQWCKRYLPDSSYEGGGEGSWVTPTADSGFLIAFEKDDSNTFAYGGCLMKTDANGNPLWVKEYYGAIPGSNGPQVINSNIYLSWWGINGTNYAVIMKTDMQGIPILANTYTNSNADGLYDGVTLKDGSTVLSIVNKGSTSSVLKVDSVGNILWANNYDAKDSLWLTNLDLTFDGGILCYGGNTKDSFDTPLSWQLIKTDDMGRDGCERPATFTKTPTPITWKSTSCYVQNMVLTVEDTILNFHSAPMDTSTLCEVKLVTKPVAKITEQRDTLCNGHCICFTDNSLNNPTSWKWSFPGASPDSSTLQNPCNVCYASPGKYSVRLIASNIGGMDTTYDSVMVVPTPTVSICCDTIIYPGEQIQLAARGGSIYQWAPLYGLSCYGCSSPVASPTQSTVYTVTVSNGGGCITTDMVSIEVSCGEVFVPNAFSPDLAINNVLYVRCDCITSMDFSVFDRWGNKVFESQNINKGWDGTYKGQQMNTDTYIWELKATLQDGTSVKKKGNVTLVR